MEGTGVNSFIRIVAEWINTMYPQLLHKCPYEGGFDLFNYTMSGNLPPESQIFPQGYYKLVVIVYKSNKAIVTVNRMGNWKFDRKKFLEIIKKLPKLKIEI